MGGETTDQNHHHRISATKSDGEASSDGVGQGKLYSPDHAVKLCTKSDKSVGQEKLYSPDHAINIATTNPNSVKSSDTEEEGEKQKKMMISGLRNISAVKDKVLEKLAAAAVPSESLENAKQFLEGVIRDFAGAAQGLTKDALHRIKSHLSVILPSVSPAVTGKIVDDAEKEVTNGEEEDGIKSKENSEEKIAGKLPYISPTSSFLGSIAKPFSKL